jgi:hypothetical protein
MFKIFLNLGDLSDAFLGHPIGSQIGRDAVTVCYLEHALHVLENAIHLGLSSLMADIA